MSKCQKDVKCQKVKHTNYGGGSQKNQIHIMRLTHIDVNFDVKYEGHQNCSKTLSMHILRVFGHHHMWHQNCCNMCELHYVNLFFLWTSSIVHVFDLLTSDIFLTTWHLFDNLTSFWQLDIFFDMWAMGHMDKWVSWLILKIEMGHLRG